MLQPHAEYADDAADYDRHTKGVPGDVEFYRALALEADGLVVELGAGTGRIAIPSALAGVRVLGIDFSAAMLAAARRKAAEAGATSLHLARGDMRRFALREPAALVTVPFRTFLHNLTTEDQLATLASVHAALQQGGRVALNVFNPDIAKITDAIRGGDEWRPDPAGFEQRFEYEPTAQLSRTTRLVRRPDGSRARVSFTLRYVYRYEMEHLLARAGFEVEALYGDHLGAPFQETSPEMVWVARRAR